MSDWLSRLSIAGSAVLCICLGGTARGQDQASALVPPRELTPSLFEWVEVSVLLQDAEGKPLPRGQLHCFNHNLGLFYPERIATMRVEEGKARIHLLRGEYTFVGTTRGVIVTCRRRVDSNCSVLLRPDASVDIRTKGLVEDGLLYAGPSHMRALLPMYFMGPVRAPASLAVSSGLRVDLQLTKRPLDAPGIAETFVLRCSSVRPGGTATFDSRKSALSRVEFGVVNAKGATCPQYNITAWMPPSAPQPTTVPRVPGSRWKELAIFATPGPALFGQFARADEWEYTFYPTIIDMKAGATYDLRSTGQFAPRLYCRPTPFPRDVLLDLPASQGRGLHIVVAPAGSVCANLQFLGPDGLVTHQESLHPTLDRRLERAPKPGTDYRLLLDLGFFGRSELRGRFHQPGDELTMTRRETEHFGVLWPDCMGDRSTACATYLENAYGAISRALELETKERIEWSPLLFGPGGAGGSHFTTHLNYLKDPRAFDPMCGFWKGAMAHEVGHVFQGVSSGLNDFGGPSAACKEAFASVMGDVALQEMMADGSAAAQRQGHRENFFRTFYRRAGFLAELKCPDDPACFEEYWRYYFILSHLTDIYGPRIHGSVARMWGNPDESKNAHHQLAAKGLRPEEAVCATYSTVVGEDLGWLFRAADFDVGDGLAGGYPALQRALPK